MQLDTYNLDGEKIGSVEIQDNLIQEESNEEPDENADQEKTESKKD